MRSAVRFGLPQCIVALLCSGLLSGCGGTIGSSLGQNSSLSLTGNWQLSIVDATGAAAFSNFAGFIDEATDGSGNLTAVFQVQPGTCYLGATTVPASGAANLTGSGATSTTAVSLNSFGVNGQYFNITSTSNSTNDQLTGTYQISGGCANGETGTVTGTRYAPLSGTYSGTLAASNQVSLSLTQGALGNGSGYSPVTGSATFSGISCFTTGTLAANNGSVLGSSAQLTFTASDGETVAITGNFDPVADTIVVTSGAISGGSCSGTLGTGTLTQT